MAVDDDTLRQYVAFGQERRSVEFKASIPWTGYQSKLTKAIIAMANSRDGGVIIIGRPSGADPPGIKQQDEATYHSDTVLPWVNRYASPSVELTLQSFESDGARYLAIVVEEFREVPVICQRSTNDGVLTAPTIYVRSLRKIESTAVQTTEDLRELLSLAIDKGVRRFAAQAARAGLELMAPPAADAAAFARQVEEALQP